MTSLDVRAIDESELRKEKRPTPKQELAVFLSEEAFDRAVERGGSDTSREVGGVLVGEVLRDAGGPYLRIETTIDALHADEKGAELTFTHATWEHIHKEMDTRHQGKRVVGWYHTHPGFGIFLSDRDQFIHKSFFNLPFQVAFVYDPKSKEHGLFTWRDNEVWRMRRYTIGLRDHTWDGNRTTAVPAEASDKTDDKGGGDRGKARDRDRDRDRDDEPLFGGSLAPLVLIGIVLVMIAAWVGHWLGSGSGNAALQQAQIEMVKARTEGAKLMVNELQHDLVTVLRDTLDGEAVHRPALDAIAAIDLTLATLEPGAPTPAAPAPVPAAAPGTPTTTPGATAPGATPPGATTPGAGQPAAPSADPRLAAVIAALKTARASFHRVTVDHVAAANLLASIEDATRQGREASTDLVRDVAAQRTGVGGLYAEMAADAAKAGDVQRAQRLLTTAAHLDPGNRARYEKQLQSFSKGATLPRGSGDASAPATPIAPMRIAPSAPTGTEGGTP